MLKPRIAVLVSGGGTNLQALIDAQSCGRLHSGELVLVVASKPGVYALERAKRAGFVSETVERAAFPSQEAYEARLLEVLASYGIDLIVLAGFMHILSAAFVSRYPDRIVNVHPSLIPAYCGKGFYGIKVHEAVLAAGETETEPPCIWSTKCRTADESYSSSACRCFRAIRRKRSRTA